MTRLSNMCLTKGLSVMVKVLFLPARVPILLQYFYGS